MAWPDILEDEERLYVKHSFFSGEDAANDESTKQWASPYKIEELLIRGWRCVVCGHTKSECARRNEFRPAAIYFGSGTGDWFAVSPVANPAVIIPTEGC